MRQDQAEDFVIATGRNTTVRDFVGQAFKEIGINIEWHGSGIDEKGLDRTSGRVLVEVDPRYFRPTEVDLLLGDPTKAKIKLGWEPKTTLPELVAMMVREDIKTTERDVLCKKNGYAVRQFNE